MDFVVMDLEWNGFFNKKIGRHSSEIIEIAAVKLDSNLCPIDSFNEYIRPYFSKVINWRTVKITSINSEDLQGAEGFPQVMKAFKAFSADSIVMTWGKTDLTVLLENYGLYGNGGLNIPFLHKYCDIQAYLQDSLDLSKSQQIGLRDAAELLNIDIEGCKAHRALADSEIAALCLREIYDSESIKKHIQDVDAQGQNFYAHVAMRDKVISRLDSPSVSKKYFDFSCKICKDPLIETGEWKYVNHRRAFCNNLSCPECARDYFARVQVKRTFSRIKVVRRINETTV